jgi:type IV pilus assembly protein PilZ
MALFWRKCVARSTGVAAAFVGTWRAELDLTHVAALYSLLAYLRDASCEESAVNDVMSDRRSFPRAPIELKVEYRRLNTFFADYTRNISRGGTFIKTQKPLDIGTEFLFKLVIPTLDNPIVLRGKVQWIVPAEKATPDEPAGMGIKFLYETEMQMQEIENRVERLMIDSLGKHLFQKLVGRSNKPSGD